MLWQFFQIDHNKFIYVYPKITTCSFKFQVHGKITNAVVTNIHVMIKKCFFKDLLRKVTACPCYMHITIQGFIHAQQILSRKFVNNLLHDHSHDNSPVKLGANCKHKHANMLT